MDTPADDMPDEIDFSGGSRGKFLSPAAPVPASTLDAARRQAADRLLTIAAAVHAAGIEPMTMQEIDAEVKAARAERRARAAAEDGSADES